MASLTDTGETRALNWLTGNSTTAPVLPLKQRLLTALGTDSTPGTEVVGGGYAPQTITLGAATGTSPTVSSNTNLIRYDNMPAVSVVGAEIWDSAGTPVRWFHGALGTTRTLLAGDPLEFPVGAVTVQAA